MKVYPVVQWNRQTRAPQLEENLQKISNLLKEKTRQDHPVFIDSHVQDSSSDISPVLLLAKCCLYYFPWKENTCKQCIWMNN